MCGFRFNVEPSHVKRIWSIVGDASLQRHAALSERLMLEGDLVENVLHGNISLANYYKCTVYNNEIHSGYKSADISSE